MTFCLLVFASLGIGAWLAFHEPFDDVSISPCVSPILTS
jgi:hypothetical protein